MLKKKEIMIIIIRTKENKISTKNINSIFTKRNLYPRFG